MTSVALKAIYPKYKWKDKRKEEPKEKKSKEISRDQQPFGYWKDINNQRTFFDNLGRELNIQQPEDWYTVDVRTVVKKGGSFIHYHYNSSLIEGN
jgi:hypothetical protein